MISISTAVGLMLICLIGGIGIGFNMMGIIEIIIDKEQKGDENDND